MAKYVAFLRGINVGGNKIVPMAKLKSILEDSGFENVRTLLASGNVIFEGKKESLQSLTKKISATLEEAFGFAILVILRDVDEIEKIVELNPFKGIEITKDTRLYVTFLCDDPKSRLKIPYYSTDKSFQIMNIKDRAIFSVLDVSKTGTVDAMAILEKEFGKNITTRNWNTIVKIVKK
jgi:uncharacterized protein (DUF1697 family)